jgi:hypothetical protein
VIYELRVYHAAPGKLEDLNRRFEQMTVKKLNEHGMKVVGAWNTWVGPNNHDLTWICAHESMEAFERNWSGFLADQEWQDYRIGTDTPVRLVTNVTNTLMGPTTWSPLQ